LDALRQLNSAAACKRGCFGEVGGAHSAESSARHGQKAAGVPCSGPPPQSHRRAEKKNMTTAGPPACVDLPNFYQTSHHLLRHHHRLHTRINLCSRLSPVQTLHFQLEPSCIFSRHPASIRRSQWPEARASHLEGRAPAVRRAPREPRSSRATLPEPVFR
jgi:hypothetical protein